jgi:hypothetical protein
MNLVLAAAAAWHGQGIRAFDASAEQNRHAKPEA